MTNDAERRAVGAREIITRAFVTLATLVAIVTPNASRARATEAGVDGEHIYAGVSYDAHNTFERCNWVLPETTYRLGVRAGLTTRTWNGMDWTLYDCRRDGESWLVWLPDVSIDRVAESARDAVRGLIPRLGENFSPSPERGLVKTPTWFWVNPLMWIPFSVTAYIPTPAGPIAVTTTATPESLEFDPGDGHGETVECDGPGLPWSRLIPSFVEPDCSYEYPVPSTAQPGGVFQSRLTVVWKVSFRSSHGVSGRLPDFRFGNTHALRIRELHAVARQ